jgi:hypothetical protein
VFAEFVFGNRKEGEGREGGREEVKSGCHFLSSDYALV